jgi:hypothetical protein
MEIAPPIAAGVAAPSPEHLAELDAARQASKKIRRVISVANFDGWAIAIFGTISLVASITSPPGILLGLGMGYIAWRELSEGAALRRLDASACGKLATNQVIFCALLTLYFLWCVWDEYHSPIDSTVLELGVSGDQVRSLTALSYLCLIVGSVLFQGGTAMYYRSRQKIVEQYLAKTPQWIIDYQRGGGTL